MRRLLSVCALLLACGDPGVDEHPPVLDPGPSVERSSDVPGPDADASDDDVVVGPCSREQRRECKLVLKVRNGIKSCVEGEQRCEHGFWGECKGKARDAAGGAAGAESQ